MPSYDYRCEGSDQVFEVSHPMAVTITNWEELCGYGNFPQEEFPADTPVRKIIGSTGGLVSSSALKNPDAPPCATGDACPGGSCGI